VLSECVRRLEEITGHKIPFYKVDLLDTDALKDVFRKVILFASTFCIFTIILLAK